MKLTVETIEGGEEELILRCRERDDRIRELERALEELLGHGRELLLGKGNADCYVPLSEILFFEASNRRLYAHTAQELYTAEYKLFELEERLPPIFVRVSKSTIVNVDRVASLHRAPVGNGTLSFRGSDRKAWFSRGYYRMLRDKLEEIKGKL